jgi:Bacterial Ig domain
MTRKSAALSVAVMLAAALALLVPSALAGNGGGGKAQGGGGHGGSCTQNAPGVSVDNNYAWSQWGSYGLPGQQLKYALHVINYDVGCGASTFVVGLSATSGFSASIPTNTITLKAGATAYVWAYVTSPNPVADGDYPLTATITRSDTSTAPVAGSGVTYYKVYSSDNVAPTLYWPNPGEGTTITGRSYNFAVSSSDDHAVKSIDLYIDGVYKSETLCDDIAYTCSLNYSWPTSAGAHTATFESTDWKGNVGSLTVGFTVG